MGTMAEAEVGGMPETKKTVGRVAALGGAIALLGFFVPYLADVEPGRHSARLVTGWALPAERVASAGSGIAGPAPFDWLLSYATGLIAVTLVMFSFHYALTARPRLARIVRRLTVLGVVAVVATAASVIVRISAAGDMTPSLPLDYVSLALYGIRHIGPGLYLGLAGFLVARLDPTI